MKRTENHLVLDDKMSIYHQCWEPDESPRALILVVHGLAEHGGRYSRLANHFVGRGYAVCALDLPGHGQSSGSNAHVTRFAQLLDAVAAVYQYYRERFPDLPCFLLGHSMGGLAATAYLLEHQQDFVGCILSGPAIKTDVQPPKPQMLLIKLLSFLLPKMGALQLDAAGVSRDSYEVRRYLEDPLVYTGKVSARTVAELFATMQTVQEQASAIELPMLILHGGEDAMASPEGSRFLEQSISSRDKTLHIYPGLYHEIFNEPEHNDIFVEIDMWCRQRLTAA
jgi:alpha-beta hydrolase superfamily lysophospholipase